MITSLGNKTVDMASGIHAQAEILISAARSGNSSALGTLFALYQNYIKLLAAAQVRARLRVRASASDIVQETFLHAHRGFADFRGTSGGEFVSWLRTILTRRIQHLYHQHVTAQQRDVRREVSIEAIGNWLEHSTIRLESLLIDEEPSPSSQVENQERSVHVADALAELPDDYREVLMMRSIEGLSFSEVAERIGRSQGATRMLWLRGIKKLKDRLQAKEQL